MTPAESSKRLPPTRCECRALAAELDVAAVLRVNVPEIPPSVPVLPDCPLDAIAVVDAGAPCLSPPPGDTPAPVVLGAASSCSSALASPDGGAVVGLDEGPLPAGLRSAAVGELEPVVEVQRAGSSRTHSPGGEMSG